MNYKIISHDSCSVIYLSGEIEGNRIHAVRAEVVEQLHYLKTPLVIDASGVIGAERDVIFITGLMNAIRREIDFKQCQSRLGSIPAFVMTYLSRTGIDELFEMSSDTDSAIAFFRTGGGHELRHSRTA